MQFLSLLKGTVNQPKAYLRATAKARVRYLLALKQSAMFFSPKRSIRIWLSLRHLSITRGLQSKNFEEKYTSYQHPLLFMKLMYNFFSTFNNIFYFLHCNEYVFFFYRKKYPRYPIMSFECPSYHIVGFTLYRFYILPSFLLAFYRA